MAFSINGLASGLDTAQIISDLMKIEKIPYTNLETKKANLQTEQGVFRAINTKLVTLNTSLGDLKYSFNINEYKATSSSNSLSATATGSAIPGSYTVEVTRPAKAASSTVNGSELLSALQAGDFKIGGLDFTKADPTDSTSTSDSSYLTKLQLDNPNISEEQKLKNVLSYINANNDKSGSTASMVKDLTSGEYIVKFTSKDASNVSITSTGLSQSVETGQTAKFKVNGVENESNTNSISDVIPGVTLNIAEATTSPVTLTVAADIDKIKGKINSFVSAYNDLIDVVKSNLAKPEDDDIVNPLQGDSILKDISSRLYTIFNELSDSGFMEDIGLSIDKGVTSPSSMTSKITFDETKFTNVLNENPTKVSSILESTTTKLSDVIVNSWTSSVKGVLASKISGYDSEIKVVDERLEAMERKLEMKEARLKLQFNNMEVMLSSLKNEQDWLSSQFESLLNSNKK